MVRKVTAPGCPGRRVHRHFRLLLTVLLVVGSQFSAFPAHAAETGLRGKVLWGPLSPGPTGPGQSDEAPVSASFTVYGGKQKVARFESDDRGCFEVSLPPGDYTIVPDKKTPIPMAEKQTTKVTVPEDGYAAVTIRLDTGMR